MEVDVAVVVVVGQRSGGRKSESTRCRWLAGPKTLLLALVSPQSSFPAVFLAETGGARTDQVIKSLSRRRSDAAAVGHSCEGIAGMQRAGRRRNSVRIAWLRESLVVDGDEL